MIGPIRRLLIEAGRAKQARAFWQASAEVLSDWAGGAHVRLVYKGLSESGTAEAGSAAQAGESCIADYHDAEGHHVQATFRGIPEGFRADVLRSGREIATHLAVMVARRATLERERRLGTFLVELSRWLLAAPERDLLLRYTLQSVVSLVEAQGAFVALRQPDGDTLRIAATVGQCVELDGADIGLTTSTTGRVVRSGEPLLTDNLLAEPDAQVALNPARSARGAMIAPLKTSSGVVGAVGVVRYDQPDAVEPAPPAFGLVDLQYLAAGAAYIAGGLELPEAGVGRDSLLLALYDRTDELRAQRELIAREKLATVGEIASGVAHEVNNPLAAIRMEAELLGRASKDPETNTTAMTIAREVDRAARIVRSLLRLARRADTTPTRVQINDLVRDVAEIRQRVLRVENVEFRTGLDQSAPPVLGLGQEP